jgi:hypothetical protein
MKVLLLLRQLNPITLLMLHKKKRHLQLTMLLKTSKSANLSSVNSLAKRRRMNMLRKVM